jgi:hypothetical protein
MSITEKDGFFHIPPTTHPEVYKVVVQSNARLMGYRLMQRRKGKDEYGAWSRNRALSLRSISGFMSAPVARGSEDE